MNTEDLIPDEWKDPKYFESLVRQNEDNKIDWERIAEFYILSEDFIREFKDKWNSFCWVCLSTEQDLSEKFIEEFKDKVDWNIICAHQKLSIPFVIKWKEDVNWPNIFRYQEFNEEEREMLSKISNHKVLPRERKMWKDRHELNYKE